jgi:hypothetical protein
MHFAKKVPTVPVQRRMHLGAVALARNARQPRVSWCALFTKAYALVAKSTPELRRAYLSFPWPHLYEHSLNIASIAFERKYQEEEAVFFSHIRSPEQLALDNLESTLRRFKEQPLQSISGCRRSLMLSQLPLPVRRLVWWFGLNVWGRKRAHYFGTFGISVYGGLGASSLHPLSPLTTTLNYGVIEPDGVVDVRIIYDHRVIDGASIARALADLEGVLTGPILQELIGKRAYKAG